MRACIFFFLGWLVGWFGLSAQMLRNGAGRFAMEIGMHNSEDKGFCTFRCLWLEVLRDFGEGVQRHRDYYADLGDDQRFKR